MMNQIMMTSSNRNIFCVTGPLCGKFTDDRWIPLTKAGALMFSLICAWINGWVNNRQAGDLKRHRAHYDVTVMINVYALTWSWFQGKRWKLSRNCYFGWICQFLLYHQHQNTHYGDVILSAMASQIICVSIVTGEFPTQRASKADIFSIWWRHHVANWYENWFITDVKMEWCFCTKLLLIRYMTPLVQNLFSWCA